MRVNRWGLAGVFASVLVVIAMGLRTCNSAESPPAPPLADPGHEPVRQNRLKTRARERARTDDETSAAANDSSKTEPSQSRRDSERSWRLSFNDPAVIRSRSATNGPPSVRADAAYHVTVEMLHVNDRGLDANAWFERALDVQARRSSESTRDDDISVHAAIVGDRRVTTDLEDGATMRERIVEIRVTSNASAVEGVDIEVAVTANGETKRAGLRLEPKLARTSVDLDMHGGMVITAYISDMKRFRLATVAVTVRGTVREFSIRDGWVTYRDSSAVVAAHTVMLSDAEESPVDLRDAKIVVVGAIDPPPRPGEVMEVHVGFEGDDRESMAWKGALEQ